MGYLGVSQIKAVIAKGRVSEERGESVRQRGRAGSFVRPPGQPDATVAPRQAQTIMMMMRCECTARA